MPVIDPPVIATAFAFWVDIDPRPRLVRSPDAVVAPVPPNARPIAEPCQVPASTVPFVDRFSPQSCTVPLELRKHGTSPAVNGPLPRMNVPPPVGIDTVTPLMT